MRTPTSPSLRLTATGNAGFVAEVGGFRFAIDAHWGLPLRSRGAGGVIGPPGSLDLILVTHAHRDHVDARVLTRAAGSALVVGPPEVTGALDPHVRRAEVGRASRGPWRISEGPAHIDCFWTSHGSSHVSYLVDIGGFRLFHDGDNEDTRILDPSSLRPIDVLLLCPWQGSGWQDSVRELAPRWWVLAHLTEEELAAHDEGRFLPELSDDIPFPERTVGLWPGQTLVVLPRGADQR